MKRASKEKREKKKKNAKCVSIIYSVNECDMLDVTGRTQKGKLLRAHGGCLGTERRRRTQQPAKRHGEQEACLDPWMSEWGNPVGVMSHYSARRANPGK